MIDRRPLAPAESRDSHSIRFTPSEWAQIVAGAEHRALQPAVFVRLLTMDALSMLQARVLTEAPIGNPTKVLAGAHRLRRF